MCGPHGVTGVLVSEKRKGRGSEFRTKWRQQKSEPERAVEVLLAEAGEGATREETGSSLEPPGVQRF